ncbi:MAG TPA: diacylglycerol kinase family protein [Bacteroidota bacterium]|nr:diacylglycerol kinase family protein [Bacteroidota bacterium]
MSKKIGVVFNPVAGKGSAVKFEHKIISSLKKKCPDYTFERTQYAGHAFHLTKLLSSQVETVIAAGGDGTVNEVAAALAGTDTPLGIVPIGSGNDFIRAIGIPRDPLSALAVALDGKRKKYDVGNIQITENSIQHSIRKKFLNTCGIGLDGEVAKEILALNHLRGLWLYGIAAMNALRHFKPIEMDIQTPFSNRHLNALLVCVGNGQYEGSGFKLTPNARPDDGFFQVCAVADMPLRRILKALFKLQYEQHGTVNGIEMFDTDKISIRSSSPFTIHADGEVLSSKALAVDISIESKQVWIQSPQ